MERRLAAVVKIRPGELDIAQVRRLEGAVDNGPGDPELGHGERKRTSELIVGAEADVFSDRPNSRAEEPGIAAGAVADTLHRALPEDTGERGGRELGAGMALCTVIPPEEIQTLLLLGSQG